MLVGGFDWSSGGISRMSLSLCLLMLSRCCWYRSCDWQLEFVIIVMLMPAALMQLNSAECTVGQIAHMSSEECRSSEAGTVRTLGLLPESRMQNGSPIVIMGPKLLSSLSLLCKPSIGLSTTRVSRRLDSGSPLEGRATASANILSSKSANWLPEFPFLSVDCTSSRQGPELNRQWSLEFLGCMVGC